MANVGFKIDSTKGFFDKAPVIAQMDKRTRGALSRFGAYVRTRAQSSMLGHRTPKGFGKKSKVRNRAGISAPGQPPLPHQGGIVRLIFFAYDDAKKSVVIGPVLYSAAKKKGAYIVPQILEEGGTVAAKTMGGKTVVMHYRPRPFMVPAFKAELPNAPKQFRE